MSGTSGPGVQLSDFQRIVFFTGAGLSAEAGLPTYRGKGGVWTAYDFEQYACQAAFDADPEKVLGFHDVRRKAMGAVAPTRAHEMIAALGRRRDDVVVITQNIDGLHQRAGSEHVIELHGSLWRVRCACPDSPREVPGYPLPDQQCPTCGAWRRPDIIWFGDLLETGPLEAAERALLGCDLLVSIGTSGSVHPAAALPQLAAHTGAFRVEINPEETAVSALYDLHLRCGATEGLERLWADYGAAASR